MASRGFTDSSMDYYSGCALDGSGDVTCWGDDELIDDVPDPQSRLLEVGMRPGGDASRSDRSSNGIEERQLDVGHQRSALTGPAIKGILKISGMAGVDESLREVCAGQGPLSSPRSVVRRHKSRKVDAANSLVVAIGPGDHQLPTALGERSGHLPREVDEEVLLGVFVDGGQLDAVDHPNVSASHTLHSPWQRRGHVVIGQGDDVESAQRAPSENL